MPPSFSSGSSGTIGRRFIARVWEMVYLLPSPSVMST